MTDELKSDPASNAVEVDVRVRVSSWAMSDAQKTLEQLVKVIDGVERLRPVLEKAGVVSSLVSNFFGKGKVPAEKEKS